jgi:GNAT superfamily N-acetyltransferase
VLRIRQVRSTADPAIAEFGRLQRDVYFDAQHLIPGEFIPRLLEARGGARHDFLLVAEEEGVLLGGTLFHYLAAAHSGFSSFMGVAAAARGRGIARQLHAARFEVLDAAAERPVPGIFIDVTAPERVASEKIEAERRFGYEPSDRRKVFQALGFRKVDVRYEQPVGGPGGGPLTTLDLLFCPRDAETARIPTSLVLETMRAYWTPWLGSERAEREVAKLRSRAGGESLALVPANG